MARANYEDLRQATDAEIIEHYANKRMECQIDRDGYVTVGGFGNWEMAGKRSDYAMDGYCMHVADCAKVAA